MKCRVDGVIIHSLKFHHDDRGWLLELFRTDELESGQLPAMAYISMTKPGVVRGPHEHRNQTDIFCFVGPSDFRLFLWDNREDSPTTGSDFQGLFGEENPALIIVPPGVVHAYENVGKKDGIVFNAPNRLYGGQGRSEEVDEIRYEDNPDSPYSTNN